MSVEERCVSDEKYGKVSRKELAGKGAGGVQQDFRNPHGLTAYIGASCRYVGRRSRVMYVFVHFPCPPVTVVPICTNLRRQFIC